MLNTFFISIFLTLSSCLFSRASADMSELYDSLSAFLDGVIFLLLLLRGPGDMGEMVDKEAGMLLALVHPASQG